MRLALLTDFGTVDPYVAVMKGVLASRTDAAIHDLTHDIPPFDVFGAAWFLATVAPWWPGTIFVCVVDPGVGTSRKIVAMERIRETQLFLAPDNGLLTMIDGDCRAVSVENEALFLPHGSSTFHGRDRFAPVAAALANGVPLDELGPPLTDIVRLDYEPPSYGEDSARGTIVRIDRFGNCITDMEAARVAFPRFALHAGQHVITRSSRTYGEAGDGPFVITGSTGHLEISVANASAAALLQLQRGDRVTVEVVSG
jgi:S-adenosyl-L-methionine hydrolase (adenosine-forming)